MTEFYIDRIPLLEGGGIEPSIVKPINVKINDEIDQSEIDIAKDQDGYEELSIQRVITFFKLAEEITVQLPFPFELHLKYTSSEWDKASKDNEGYPLIAYLKKSGESWDAEWLLYSNTLMTIEDITGDYSKELIIEIDDLEDPLIGGC